MKYVWCYIAVCGFNVLIACVAYVWFPTYRHYLLQEDSLVENLSAMFFLLSSFLSLLFLVKLKDHKKLLIFVLVVGLIGFLDELSFGERIFGFAMPSIGRVKIDAIHDFFDLAYRYRSYSYPLTGIGGILIVTLVSYWVKLMLRHPSKGLGPHYVLLMFFAALVFSASVIDLEIVKYPPLFVLEEIFEMNAGIALVFCCLSLPNMPLHLTRFARR